MPALIGAIEGHRIWARDYDEAPNPLLALEMRLVSPRLDALCGLRVLDAGSGTGRWMEWLAGRGAQVFGIDGCLEMVQRAAQKPGLAGRAALGDLRRIPIASDAADLALCSFTIGYLSPPGPVFKELARVARRVMVADLHPDAARAGWTRSFRSGDRVYDLIHHGHSVADLDDSASRAGLTREWRVEGGFGEPEREVFRRAGREHVFESACRIPAVLATLWRR